MRSGLVCALLCVFSSAYAHAEDLTIITHELRPFVWVGEDKAIHGAVFDLVASAAGELGYRQNAIELYPFARALMMLRKLPGVALFPVARTASREGEFKWAGPVVSNGVYVYTLKSNKLVVHSLEDLKKMGVIGVGHQNASMAVLVNAGIKNFYPVDNELQAVKMLWMGRVDAVPIGELVMESAIKDLGYDPDVFEKTEVKLYESALYVAFSKDVPDGEVQRWQQVIEKRMAQKTGR